MATVWTRRVFLFIPVTEATPTNRNTLAAIFALYSGETALNEGKLFDKVIRLSFTGELPALFYGTSFAVEVPDMRDDLITFINGLTQVRYYVITNTAIGSYFNGELVADSKYMQSLPTLVGTAPFDTRAFTPADALIDLNTDFGVQIIAG